MKNEKILALRVSLLIALSYAQKKKNVDDGGTSNIDTPVLFLPFWNMSDIEEAFKLTGLVPSKHGNAIFILRACEGQGFRRTAMAEAFSNSMKEQGYMSGVDYRMD